MSIKALKCPSCGADIEIDDSREFGFCSYCGSRIQIGERVNINMNVKHEYEDIPPRNVHIHNHYTIHNDGISKSRKIRLIALVLCVVLGIFGVHHFYVGRIGWGLLYLFTAGLFAIGWIVDIILILAGSYKDCDGLPLEDW